MRCISWSTPLFPTRTFPKYLQKMSACVNKQVWRKPVDPQTCEEGIGIIIITYCVASDPCVLIFVPSALYMWIQQFVQHFQWFNKELTAFTPTRSCHSRPSRERHYIYSIQTNGRVVNEQEKKQEKCKHSVTRLTMDWVKRIKSCLMSPLLGLSWICVMILK